ncbi:nephrin-like [Penaeus indicus]|uniref:nephrin-like n=1 Tax=Penaeus indicus TaxID=29960 RepID=UPI00300D6ED3
MRPKCLSIARKTIPRASDPTKGHRQKHATAAKRKRREQGKHMIKGVKGEQQLFLVTPESVRVRAGDDVFLRCIVRNQQGNAQWTKDGFALGFGRTVPGYPRYRYAGDSARGEHHLVIKGVTLQDDGEYQCQVGPTANATAIWAAANVTVLVPPEIISINGRPDGAAVRARAGSGLTLECLVEKGRPAPRVTWLRNGLQMDPGQQEDEILASPSSPLLWTVRSRVRLRARVEDDGQRYTCRALQLTPELDENQDNLAPPSWNLTNSADETPEFGPPHVQAGTRENGDTIASRGDSAISSQLPPTSSQDAGGPSAGGSVPLEVSVVISVLLIKNNTLPEPHHRNHDHDIKYNTRNYIERGVVLSRATDEGCREATGTLALQHERSLACQMGLTMYTISYDETHKLSEGDSVNLTCTVGAANPRPRLSWFKDGLEITPRPTDTAEQGLDKPSASLSITKAVTATRMEDGAVYECRVNTSLFSRPLASDVTLSVQYPPSNVTMTGPEVVGSGNSVTFTCITSSANPAANVTWTIHGSLNKRSKSSVTRGPEGGWVTTSTLTYRVARSSNELVVRCMARNAASSSPVITSKSVQVIKTPKPPVVEADMKGTVVAGTVLDLTCTTHGGHPPRQVKYVLDGMILVLETLVMFKGEEQMDIEVEEDENMTVAHTAITVEPSDNKAKIVCEVQNPTSQEPLTGHTTISLFCIGLVPAWEVKGWVNPRSVEVKEEVTLGCETSPSIPPSTVTWHSGGATLEGATTKQYPGKYGGTVTSSELRVRPLADDNGRVFSCNANNGLGVTVSADLVIDVLQL